MHAQLNVSVLLSLSVKRLHVIYQHLVKHTNTPMLKDISWDILHSNIPQHQTRKGGEIRDTKTLNLSRNIVSLQVFVDVSRFSPCAINLARNKNICCRLKKVVVKSRALVYFEQQILALLLVFHRTHNLSRNKCRHIRSTPSKSTNKRAAFLQPATHVFVAGQVGQVGQVGQKLATKQRCATS